MGGRGPGMPVTRYTRVIHKKSQTNQPYSLLWYPECKTEVIKMQCELCNRIIKNYELRGIII